MTAGNRIIVAAIVVGLARIGFLGWHIAGARRSCATVSRSC